MRWLLTEDWGSHIYAEPFYQRLAELGEEVHAFKECTFFQSRAEHGTFATVARTWLKTEKHFSLGFRVWRLNQVLLHTVKELKPDVLFVFRGEHIWPRTLRVIKQMGTHLICWHNDNPFSPHYPWYKWRHFRRCMRHYDRLYAYRSSNVEDFKKAGGGRVELLRSFYLRELNHPLTVEPGSRYASDVSFIGHWEPDGRDNFIATLLDSSNVDFRLWGTLWERSPLYERIRGRFSSIAPVYKEDYNLALNSTKIALVFLSRLNQDTYTRRCFEIPAAGTFMLSQYTPELASMFAEGKEAEYFRDVREMVEKISYYLAHDEERRKIARAGHARILVDGHEASDRARQVRANVIADLALTSIKG